MSEFKKGDRVKVIYEGQVSACDASFMSFETLNGRFQGGLYTDRGGVTVEKLPDPLPTTPGSVINFGSIYRMLAGDGKWYRPGVPDGARPETLVLNYRVLHDAGRAS